MGVAWVMQGFAGPVSDLGSFVLNTMGNHGRVLRKESSWPNF